MLVAAGKSLLHKPQKLFYSSSHKLLLIKAMNESMIHETSSLL
ncbi:hypothetical protein NRI_0107 [Neorickettsia risticii str. Illinois]|uniref:Uncharacterized protein n=1 Tax=Neorickettsia risticii (strain Illinois) TaxID=434131 RepID=C6V3Y8_NEORI|nr:hypothetical protein NRI_0107 [Neorickettsia risticii str. Illinois]